MDLKKRIVATGICLVMAASALAPAAMAGKTQNAKNTARNGAIAGAGAAVLGVVTHSPLLAIGGLVGGAYAAKKYEDERKEQREKQRERAYYHRHHRDY